MLELMSNSLSRRDFLRAAACVGAVAAGTLAGCSPLRSTAKRPTPDRPKLIIVLFGGGTRSRETIDDPEHRHIPRLWREMIPRGALLTNMRVEGKVVHPNSAGSIMTGHWEWDDIDWSRPVAYPTIFEIYRQARQAPDTAAWAFVYASILAGVGESRTAGYGRDFAANVVEPPTIPRDTAEEMERLMRQAASTGSLDQEQDAARQSAYLARTTSLINLSNLHSPAAREFIEAQYAAWKAGTGTTSHDAFLAERALACMARFEPDVMLVAFGEIDCAHYGSWSRYVEAIRRTDELTWQLWQAAETHPAYRGRTLMLILPDHGRELDRPGGSGFIHHSDFYTNQGADEGCRRVWMLALGPGVAAARRSELPVPITTVAATGLAGLGLKAPGQPAASVWNLLAK